MKNITFLFLLFSTVIYSQTTYTKIANGSWDDPNGWEDGMIPPNPIEQNSIVNLGYRTFIDFDLINNGEINCNGELKHYVQITSATLTNNGEFNNQSFFEIRNSTAKFVNNGNFTNDSYFHNNGTLEIGSDGVFKNTSNSVFRNWSVNNNGGVQTCSGEGVILNSNGGIFCNDAGFSNGSSGTETGFNLSCFDGGTYVDGMTNNVEDIPTCEFVGTEDVTQNLFSLIKVVPNPVGSTLKMETQLALDGIQIYSVLGERVISSSNLEQGVDVSMLSPGIYFAQIKTGNNQITKKFIK